MCTQSECIACSLQQWSHAELDVRPGRGESVGGGHSPGLHYRVEAEKVRREHMLDIRQLLAREVMQKSRQVAGRNNNNINFFCTTISTVSWRCAV